MSELEKALRKAVEKETKDLKEVAALFSGGVDSSIIAKLVSENINSVCFAVGLDKSPVLKRASKAAEMLGLRLVSVIVEKETIQDYLEKARSVTEEENFVKLSIAIPELIGFEAVSKAGFRHAFMGQGADELFFGYDYFRKDSSEERRKKALQDLEEQLSMEKNLAESAGVKLRYPFLEEGFVKEALGCSGKDNLKGADDLLRKHILRNLALEIGIPKEIALERKKAMQYDSETAKELKKLV